MKIVRNSGGLSLKLWIIKTKKLTKKKNFWSYLCLVVLIVLISLYLFCTPSVTDTERPPIIPLLTCNLTKPPHEVFALGERKMPLGEYPKLTPAPQIVVQPNQFTINIIGVEHYRGLVAKYFPADQVNNALRIMRAESGGNPQAISKTNDHGLMQINYETWFGYTNLPINMAYDPETNIRIASYIFNVRGWNAWSTKYVL